MITDGNMDIHKEIKSTENGNMGKYMSFDFLSKCL